MTALKRLANAQAKSGLLRLLNPDGLKVDGVAYTKDQADAEGWSLIF
jgi:hypothetical protein